MSGSSAGKQSSTYLGTEDGVGSLPPIALEKGPRVLRIQPESPMAIYLVSKVAEKVLKKATWAFLSQPSIS